MSKYKTKEIDYTGCDPIIAEHLQRREAIFCSVVNNNDSGDDWINSYDITQGPTPYVGEYSNYTQAKPIEVEMRVKKASEIVKWFEDNGYILESLVARSHGGTKTFNPTMLRHCGTTPPSTSTWYPDWLEEVPTTEEKD